MQPPPPGRPARGGAPAGGRGSRPRPRAHTREETSNPTLHRSHADPGRPAPSPASAHTARPPLTAPATVARDRETGPNIQRITEPPPYRTVPPAEVEVVTINEQKRKVK